MCLQTQLVNNVMTRVAELAILFSLYYIAMIALRYLSM